MSEREWMEAVIKANLAGLVGCKVVAVAFPATTSQAGIYIVVEAKR